MSDGFVDKVYNIGRDICRQIKDPGLLAVIFLFLTGTFVIGRLMPDTVENLIQSVPFGIMEGGLLLCCVMVLLYCRRREPPEVGELKKQLDQLQQTKAKQEAKLAHAARVIDKNEYAKILKNWNDAGAGHVLLYNIEMQSFANPDKIKDTWGGLARLTGINSVVLLLPDHKIKRWESVVVREETRFFADEANRKFDVCAISSGAAGHHGDAPTGVAFALYRFGSDPGNGRLHDTAVVFVLSKPFSELRPAMVPGDSEWWDYHHILEFSGDENVIKTAENIWNRNYLHERTRPIARVLADAKPLEPIKPGVLFERLGVSKPRCDELLQHFSERSIAARTPKRIPLDEPDGDFTLTYDNLETIEGHYSGVDVESKQPKPALVWIGGFTERRATKLPELFERVLKRESVVQFYYQVSPPIECVTLTRYMQDMREVLSYINAQHKAVAPDQIVLIARSINGLLAALVGAEEKCLDALAGVILIAPVFDVIEMMDNYRAATGQPDVRVEHCWRSSPGYTGDKWENRSPEYRWLEFFGHDVSLSIMGDIIQHEPETFSLSAFKRSVGTISQRRPIYILSHPDDPITGSKRALETLKHAASGTGLIRQENYRSLKIDSSHLPADQIDRDAYPFAIRDEVERVHETFRDVLMRMGIPVTEHLPQQD